MLQGVLKLGRDVVIELFVEQELFDLFIGFLNEFFDLLDGLPEVVIVEALGLHVLEVVAEQQLVLAEPLDGLDEVGVEGIAGCNADFLEQVAKAGVVAVEDLGHFVGLGVVGAVARVHLLEIVLPEELVVDDRRETGCAMVVVLHHGRQLHQELLVLDEDLLEVGEEQCVHLLVVDHSLGQLHHILDDGQQVVAVGLLRTEQLISYLDFCLLLLNAFL